MSTNISKRNSVPSRIVSPEEKLDAIHRVRNGETKAAVARDINIPESTLRGWCKNQDKISYLSKKPGRDEYLESNSKIPKLDADFDIKLKDYSYMPDKTNLFKTKNQLILNTSPIFTSSVPERKKNKVGLSRLGMELGLNNPEMFLPNLNNSTNDATNKLLLTHWNTLLLQQMKYKTENNSISNYTNDNVLGTINQTSILSKMSNNDQFQNGLVHPPVSNNGLISKNVPSANFNMNNVNCDKNFWFWNWYQQTAHNEQQTKPISYQQLTKQAQKNVTSNDQNARNLCIRDINNKTEIRCRSVLDNLFNNSNLPSNNEETEENTLSHQEAIQHGEKFLRWLEAHNGPSFTAVQIMQFKTLLNNVKSGIDKKKCDIVHKSKAKRK